jgi:hypothetical protein
MRQTSRKRGLLIPVLVGGGAFFILFFAYSCGFGGSDHPIGMVFSIAPITGAVAFGIVCLVAGLSRRPVVPGDVVRIACWTIIGIACGVGNMADAYYKVFWRQYAQLVSVCSASVTAGALGVIIVSIFVLPRAPLPSPEGHCRKCGYSLRGLETLRCPECGEPFQSQDEIDLEQKDSQAKGRVCGPDLR